MKKGWIKSCSFEKVEELDLEEFDYCLHVTRSIQQGIRPAFIHVPQLSPSSKLLQQTMYRWKKAKLTPKERAFLATSPTGTWWDLYEPAFLEEMESREDFKRAYRRLTTLLDQGYRILLVCYCEDAERCHRSLILKQLAAAGYEVEID